jgi:ankyrin repeat protein
LTHCPIALVGALLEAGADPNWPAHDGFPPLLAAGARVDQRGVNDYTPLHFAAAHGDLRMVDILSAAGADPDEIARIDDYETALEVAATAGREHIVERLRPLTTSAGGR